ncbi:MAG TPA: ABC transporter ATP-binding protein [Candidatus Gracilibacteria bacterium]|nr:ABC transporter ATP-binding protein [Candidatus Gracilibacteria bacterium]
MLTISKLTANYGGPDILKNVNIHIKEGEIVTIIGPNGAGKSTILKSIFGMTNIVEGKINFYEENMVGVKTADVIKRGICYVPQGRSVFPSLTVEENLEMGAFIRSDKAQIKKDLHYVYEKFPKLYQRRHQKTKTMSGGEQQMVSIGRALMLQPQLLLLDEPSIGLAPKIVEEVFQKCKEIKQSGTAVLMVEQNANIALEYSDRGYVLELGENRLEGTGKELLSNKKVGELYLGK